ncbi:MAG: histidine kinase dimerization/phosphoacceptor domain -containing protein [Pseudomonadota bacterium]
MRGFRKRVTASIKSVGRTFRWLIQYVPAILAVTVIAHADAQTREPCKDAAKNFHLSNPSPCLDAFPSLPSDTQDQLIADYLTKGQTYIPAKKVESIAATLSDHSRRRLLAVGLVADASARVPDTDRDVAKALISAVAKQDQLALGYLYLAKSELARIDRNRDEQLIALDRAAEIATDTQMVGLSALVQLRRGQHAFLMQDREGAVDILAEAIRSFQNRNNFRDAGEACRLAAYAIEANTSLSDEQLESNAIDAKTNDPGFFPCLVFARMYRAHQQRDDLDAVVALADVATKAALEQHYLSIPPVIKNSVAINAKRNGDYVRAAQFYQEAADAFEQSGNSFMVAGITTNLGILLSDLGDTDTAIDLFKSSLNIIQDIAPHRLDGVLKSQNQIGKALARSGRHDEAVGWFAKARQTSSQQTFRMFDGLVDAEYARSLYETGAQDAAFTTAENAVNSFLNDGDRAETIRAASVLVWAATKRLERGELSDAENIFAQVQDLMNPTNASPEFLKTAVGDIYTRISFARGMSDLLTQLDQPDRATEYARVALDLSETRFENEKIRAAANAELKFAIKNREQEAITLAKNAELAGLNAEQSRQQSLISLMIALLAGLFAIFLWWSFRSQKRLAETRALFLVEMQHRTKNNLQVLSSLLNMDARRLAKSGNSNTSQKDAANRAQAMALINDHMYGRQESMTVAVQPFVHDLIKLIRSSYQKDNITLACEVDPVFAAADDVTPLGLLICELVTNAFKHAFNSENSGTIEVHLKRDSGGMILCVSDNGKGFDGDTPYRKGSLGVGLIEDLSDQLGGRLAVTSSSTGTMWKLSGIPDNRFRMSADIS